MHKNATMWRCDEMMKMRQVLLERIQYMILWCLWVCILNGGLLSEIGGSFIHFDLPEGKIIGQYFGWSHYNQFFFIITSLFHELKPTYLASIIIRSIDNCTACVLLHQEEKSDTLTYIKTQGREGLSWTWLIYCTRSRQISVM